MLQQRAALSVHDAFRHAGRAAGEHDKQRVVEGDALELDDLGAARIMRQERRSVTICADRQFATDPAARSDTATPPICCRLGSWAENSATRANEIMLLAAVPIPVGGDQHLRLDLAEAVEHALHAEIGRAGRPDAADRCGRQRADHRFGRIRHKAPRPDRPASNPANAFMLRQAADAVVQLAPG